MSDNFSSIRDPYHAVPAYDPEDFGNWKFSFTNYFLIDEDLYDILEGKFTVSTLNQSSRRARVSDSGDSSSSAKAAEDAFHAKNTQIYRAIHPRSLRSDSVC